jgi:HPr kinase/phosphorylase
VDGKGLLILGKSGTGKSTLALEMIALGAELVADDQVQIERNGEHLSGSCPGPIQGKIEARQIGLLKLPFIEKVRLFLIADLDKSEKARFPTTRYRDVNGISLEVIHCATIYALPSKLMLYIRSL